MSTPSTATATIPAHQSHYGYSHHSAYHTNASGYQSNSGLSGKSNNTLHNTSRLEPSYSYSSLNNNTHRNSGSSSNQAATFTPATTSHSAPAPPPSAKPQRKPDWQEFYKNGPPKEIIVIDDDSPAPPSRKENRRPDPTDMNKQPAHASKKRKTQAAAYETVHHQPSYSHTNTPHYASNTISTDRTTSLQTTAPTSLGSHGSGGSGGAYVEEVTVGQKRKRVTRQTTNEEKKRKEIEVVGDAYSTYVPPPKPPIKASEVFVQPIKDVRHLPSYDLISFC